MIVDLNDGFVGSKYFYAISTPSSVVIMYIEKKFVHFII